MGKGEISPFPTVFSTRFGELFVMFIKFKIVVCKLFQFVRAYNLLFGKGLKIIVKDKMVESSKMSLLFVVAKMLISFNMIGLPFLTLSQTANFRLIQTERVCRRQF